jgi:HEAT repeat protein
MDAPGRDALLLELVSKENDAYVFGQAANHLAYLGTPEARRALQAAAETHSLPAGRLAAHRAMMRYGKEPPPSSMILAVGRSDDPMLRADGLTIAFERGLPEARDLAREALSWSDATEAVVRAGVRILGAAGDPKSVAALLARADALTGALRPAAVALLRPIRDPASVDILVERLTARSASERALAADALAGIPGGPVVGALVSRLGKERDATVRAAILRGLGEREDLGARKAVLAAVDPARASVEALDAALRALAKGGLGDPDVLTFFRKAAASRQPERRVVAMAAAAASGDVAAVDLLLAAIDDEARPVRILAVEGLGRIRVKRAVPPLIDRLEEEESPRIRQAAAESLFRITGQNYYDIAKLWRKWWKESGETFVVPQAVPQRPRQERADGSSASFYGIPVDSDRIVFVIDQSGSMSMTIGTQTKLERAVEETLNVIAKLSPKTRVNVILFESSIHAWQKRLVRLSKGSRTAIGKHLRAQRPTGGTNLYDGLEMALLTPDVDTIYLLSDGAPGQGKFVKHEDIVREIANLNRTKRIAIHCVAVGFDSPLLKELAARNHGQYVKR